MSEPIAKSRIWQRAAAALAVFVPLSWWALRDFPSGVATIASEASTPNSSGSVTSAKSRHVVSADAFRIPLWISPPAPPEVPVVAAAPRRELRWQLLAIASDERGNKALFYHAPSDRLAWLRPGEVFDSATVELVESGSVSVRDGDSVRSFALRPEAGPSSGAPR